ncbi:MAG: carbon-nitrogen hydrolase family protein, partial [Vicinamibacterales bacterium]
MKPLLHLLAIAALTCGAFVSAADPQFKLAEPWSPHPKTTPVTARQGDAFAVEANGTRMSVGGWQWSYEGIVPGQTYELSVDATHDGLSVPRDELRCIAIWGKAEANKERFVAIWDFLMPEMTGAKAMRFTRKLVAPEGAHQLVIRSTLRWTAEGKAVWQQPKVSIAQTPLVARAPVKVSVVTGRQSQRTGLKFKSIQDNIDFYGKLIEKACERDHPQLVVLPEVALQFGIGGDALDKAVPAPGPETDAFAAIAKKHRVRIALGMYERNGDAVHNSVVLISPAGKIEGRYRKVHLAGGGEDCSGILPGEGFPVFETDVARIGCNICMDSSVAESSRMVGLNGADLLLMPIMGDHRADRWTLGPPNFNEDRWRVIMRAHAIDNQLCMVVARNST